MKIMAQRSDTCIFPAVKDSPEVIFFGWGR
ncbi:hypothetical protein NX02_23670 [Sphingomonas sanxanigenens DSM 19645 = NX02]|uniref:Uncharacterized protein n=1 Tax=Sphingomonas sanxanigenens DSM 19645 = NX02 TaxID=1123269 RepID=W0AGU2_9SPHN|nr:hypothetical protein NX02_23670 [Sphingomonas sanxanigenens DSM 19645 = NX02]